MNIQTLDQQTMTALETLAQTNVKIGEARGILADLKLTETSYFEEREKATIEKIQAVLDDSEGIVAKIHDNYYEITQFYADITSFVGFLSQIQESVQTTIESFNKKVDVWEGQTKREEERLGVLRQNVETQQKQLDIDKKSRTEALKKIKDEKQLINSRQQQIAEALKVLEQKTNHA